ncbi:MAG: RluA family pseudouridine synthase [Peptococcaceae bacterium]|jgi:23S rRNA pseudouridine1911/1915/1917 synthase|nr:RluA family pseudouridine synthase [Peptococcaceae bacterium]
MVDDKKLLLADGDEADNWEEMTVETEGERLDSYLAGLPLEYSRARWQKMIKDEQVLRNGKPTKSSVVLQKDDVIAYQIPPVEMLELTPENIPLDIVYEDSDLLVVNKPQGMVVHPAAGNYHGTLVNALLYAISDLSGINGVIRPGIVHRIDKDTSGLLVVAKNDKAHLALSEQLKDHTMARVYYAIVHGVMGEPGGVIDAPIGRHAVQRKKMAVDTKNGKPAITHYRVLERFTNYSLLELKLETGRTHQIRVHLSYLGNPVAGDPLYGPKKNPLGLAGQALHAKEISFIHPTSKEKMTVTCDLPDYFMEALEQLRKER